MSRPISLPIDGILLLDKPLGLTSNSALQRVKRLFYAKKAGHTGSLDPLATGMLPICFGEATKFSQVLLESDKCYEMSAKLGVKTLTGDAEGDIISTKPVNVTRADIEKIVMAFRGEITQIPPMYSAVKINGQPLYELARQGIEIERASRNVQIYDLRLIDFQGDSASFSVRCSKGTYIRTLIEDMGEALGCGAHVSALHRSFVSPFDTARSVSLDALEDLDRTGNRAELMSHLLPTEAAVSGFPAVHLSQSATFYLRTGQPVSTPQLPLEGFVRLFSDEGRFLGVGEVLEDRRVAPRRLVNTA